MFNTLVKAVEEELNSIILTFYKNLHLTGRTRYVACTTYLVWALSINVLQIFILSLARKKLIGLNDSDQMLLSLSVIVITFVFGKV